MPAEAFRAPKASSSNILSNGEDNVVSRLRAHAAELEEKISVFARENEDLKFKLKETEAILGRYVVAASRQAYIEPTIMPSNPKSTEPSLKRARSPSLEIVEIPELARKKGKAEESTFISTLPTMPPHSAPSKSTLVLTTPTKPRIAQPSSLPMKTFNLSPSEKKFSNLKTEPESEEEHRVTHWIINLDRAREEQQSSTDVGLSNATSSTPLTILPSGYVAESDEDEFDPNGFQYAPGPLLLGSLETKLPTLSTTNVKNMDDVKKEVKVKDVFSLPASTVKRHLGSAKPLTITLPALHLEVPRTFLRLAYGGSDQQFLQFIQAGKNPSGPYQRRIVFPMLDMNPAMPSTPGEPGLVFASRHEILSDPPWTLFCKRSKIAPAVWLYLGEYESVLCGKMTAEQFKAQTSITKLEWARLILKKKAFDVYVAMRARIALRKFGILPAKNQQTEEKLIHAEMQAVKNNKGRKLTENEIITAFSNGDEGIDIIRMTCVKYDHVFASDMKEQYSNYDALILASKRKKAEGKVHSRKFGASKQAEAVRRLSNAKKQGQISKLRAHSKAMSMDNSDGQEEDGRAGDSDLDYVASDRETSYSGSVSASRPRRRAAAHLSFSYLTADGDEELSSPFGDDLTDIEDGQDLVSIDGRTGESKFLT